MMHQSSRRTSVIPVEEPLENSPIRQPPRHSISKYRTEGHHAVCADPFATSHSSRRKVTWPENQRLAPFEGEDQRLRAVVSDFEECSQKWRASSTSSQKVSETATRSRGTQNYVRLHNNIERMQSEIQHFYEEQLRRAIEANPHVTARLRRAQHDGTMPDEEDAEMCDQQQELLDGLITNLYQLRQSSMRFMSMFLNDEDKRHLGARLHYMFGDDAEDEQIPPTRRYVPQRVLDATFSQREMEAAAAAAKASREHKENQALGGSRNGRSGSTATNNGNDDANSSWGTARGKWWGGGDMSSSRERERGQGDNGGGRPARGESSSLGRTVNSVSDNPQNDSFNVGEYRNNNNNTGGSVSRQQSTRSVGSVPFAGYNVKMLSPSSMRGQRSDAADQEAAYWYQEEQQSNKMRKEKHDKREKKSKANKEEKKSKSDKRDKADRHGRKKDEPSPSGRDQTNSRGGRGRSDDSDDDAIPGGRWGESSGGGGVSATSSVNPSRNSSRHAKRRGTDREGSEGKESGVLERDLARIPSSLSMLRRGSTSRSVVSTCGDGDRQTDPDVSEFASVDDVPLPWAVSVRHGSGKSSPSTTPISTPRKSTSKQRSSSSKKQTSSKHTAGDGGGGAEGNNSEDGEGHGDDGKKKKSTRRPLRSSSTSSTKKGGTTTTTTQKEGSLNTGATTSVRSGSSTKNGGGKVSKKKSAQEEKAVALLQEEEEENTKKSIADEKASMSRADETGKKSRRKSLRDAAAGGDASLVVVDATTEMTHPDRTADDYDEEDEEDDYEGDEEERHLRRHENLYDEVHNGQLSLTPRSKKKQGEREEALEAERAALEAERRRITLQNEIEQDRRDRERADDERRQFETDEVAIKAQAAAERAEARSKEEANKRAALEERLREVEAERDAAREASMGRAAGVQEEEKDSQREVSVVAGAGAATSATVLDASLSSIHSYDSDFTTELKKRQLRKRAAKMRKQQSNINKDKKKGEDAGAASPNALNVTSALPVVCVDGDERIDYIPRRSKDSRLKLQEGEFHRHGTKPIYKLDMEAVDEAHHHKREYHHSAGARISPRRTITPRHHTVLNVPLPIQFTMRARSIPTPRYVTPPSKSLDPPPLRSDSPTKKKDEKKSEKKKETLRTNSSSIRRVTAASANRKKASSARSGGKAGNPGA